MRTIRIILALLALSVSMQGFAHGNHKRVSVDEAINIARSVAVRLTESDQGMGFGRLDGSWTQLGANDTAISKSGPGYYIVALKNMAEDRTLYVLMSNTGDVYDANFTGLFDGIQ